MVRGLNNEECSVLNVRSVCFAVAPAIGVSLLEIDALILFEAEQQLIVNLMWCPPHFSKPSPNARLPERQG
jgi:hypothetical protein